jgi:HEAT repeat protein
LRQTGVAVVPLLTSLKERADWAAHDGRLYGPVEDSGDGEATPTVITQLVRSRHAQVRGASIELLRDMFASGIIPNSRSQIESVVNVLKGVLQSDEDRTSIRLAAIEAFNHLLSRNLAGRDVRLPRNVAEMLADQATEAPTYAERAAATEAFSRAGGRGMKDSILESLKRLPLDELPAREELYLRAAAHVAPADAERLIRDRLQRSIGARQSLESEVETLIVLGNNGIAPPLPARTTEKAADALEAVKDAAVQNAAETAKDVEGSGSKAIVPLLLDAAIQSDVSLKDRKAIAKALGHFDDDRAVPILVRWLRHDNYQLGPAALAALEAIDSDAAAREIRPLLKTEPQLSTKLRIARLLARHGIDDGYSLATEHLADPDFTASAALVLAALDDPRTTKDLTAILEGRSDRRWQAAALTGLVVVGDEAGKKRLLDILNDERNPLAADAAVAVGLSADADLLPPLAKLVQSRNPQIAMSSLVALRRFFSGVRNSPHGLDAVNFDEHKHAPYLEEVPEEMRKELAKAVASLVADPYVAHNVRQEAFAVARLLDHHEYESLLSELADQAELEGTPLLLAVQAARKARLDLIEKFLC